MATVHCSCGEQLHYSADKAGLIARCRCGRPVRLPEPPPELPPAGTRERVKHAYTGASVRTQVLTVLFAAIVLGALAFVLVKTFSRDEPRRQQAPLVEPP